MWQLGPFVCLLYGCIHRIKSFNNLLNKLLTFICRNKENAIWYSVAIVMAPGLSLILSIHIPLALTQSICIHCDNAFVLFSHELLFFSFFASATLSLSVRFFSLSRCACFLLTVFRWHETHNKTQPKPNQTNRQMRNILSVLWFDIRIVVVVAFFVSFSGSLFEGSFSNFTVVVSPLTHA